MRWALDNSAIKPEPLAVEAHILSPELSGKPKTHSQSRNTEQHRKVLEYKAPLKNKCYLSSSWLQWSKMQKQSQSLENMLNKSVLRNHLLGGWQTFLVKGQIANISVFVGYNVSHIFCFPTTPPQPLQKLKL